MRANRVRQIWRDGGAVVNGWLQIPSSYSAELMAHQGWDSLTIDLQHGPVDYQRAVEMFQAIATTEVTPLARVPWNEPGIIMKLLDAGCYGIICPMINSRQECEAFVGACRYPPAGYRSIGPNRATLYAGADYVAKANETVLTFAMIETRQALDHLDAILSVPGLDAIYVGPSDLAHSLGFSPGSDLPAPHLEEPFDRILAACERHGIVPGLHAPSPEAAARMIERGFKFATIQSDGRLLAVACQSALKIARGGAAPAPAPAPRPAAQPSSPY